MAIVSLRENVHLIVLFTDQLVSESKGFPEKDVLYLRRSCQSINRTIMKLQNYPYNQTLMDSFPGQRNNLLLLFQAILIGLDN